MDAHIEEVTLDELAERAGTSPRTIRFYIAEGLLPGPGSRGKGALYGEEHLTRLRLIRLLGEQRVPLAKIRATLEGLAPEELREMLAREDVRLAELRAAERAQSPKAYLAKLLEGARQAREPDSPPSAKPYGLSIPPSAPSAGKRTNERTPYGGQPAETWTRFELAPGVELHIRPDAGIARRELIERLLATAREESDQSGE